MSSNDTSMDSGTDSQLTDETDGVVLQSKHVQALVDAYNLADSLVRTFEDSQHISVPDGLVSLRNKLKHVALDVGLLEQSFVCSRCGHDEWRSEVDVAGRQPCPECDCPMTAAATREVEQ